MKTWEMIKELTENPNKKFVSDKGQDENEMIAERELGNIKFKYTHIDTGVDRISPWRIWKEVKEPVSFMEAVASGKNIKVEHSIISPDFLIYYLNLELLLKLLNDNFKVSQVRTILLEGKFYIEEEN